MYKFSCVCQNYHGFLCVSENDFYFTSSLFRVNLKWSNVKSVLLDVKYVKNTATSVLVIKLHQIPISIQNNPEIMKRRKSPQAYIFYGFHDLISVEEHIKHCWRASGSTSLSTFQLSKDEDESNDIQEEATSIELVNTRSSSQAENYLSTSSSKPMKHYSISKVPTLTAYPGSDLRPSAVFTSQILFSRRNVSPQDLSEKMPRRQEQEFISVFHNYGVILLSKLFLCLYLIIFFLVFIAGIYIYFSTQSGGHNLFLDTQHLFEELEVTKENYRRLNKHTSIRGQKTTHSDVLFPFKDSSILFKSLDKIVEALLRKYVKLQLEMIDLKQGHMERSPLLTHESESRTLFQSKQFYETDSSAFITKDIASVKLVLRTAHIYKKSPQQFMHTRLRGVFQGWYSSLRSFRIFYLFSTHQGSRFQREEDLDPSKGRVRYTESFFNDYEITQYVSPEEANERIQCLRISNELLKISDLIEELFFRVNSLFLPWSYEDYPFSPGKPQHWNESGATNGVHTPYNFKRELFDPYFSTDDILHIMFLRRYADIVRYLNPLESNEYKRREDAAAAAYKAVLLKEHKVKHLNGMNRTVKDILSLFSSVAVDAPTEFGALKDGEGINIVLGMLRNLLAELQFWDNDKDLWDLHLLTSLTNEQKKQFFKAFHTVRSQTQATGNHSSGLASDYLKNVLASVSNFSHLRYLPIFKGQLCFSQKPNLWPTAPKKFPQCSTSVRLPYSFLLNTSSLRNHTQHRFNHLDEEDLPGDEAPLKNAYHNIYNPNHVDAMVVILKERWLDELAAFSTLFKSKLVGSSYTRNFAYMDADTDASRELSALAMRLFNIFDRIGYWYITPLYQSRRFFKWPSFISLIIRWLFGTSQVEYVEAADPFAELRKAQITKIPWGNNSDVPFHMMQDFLLRPPGLLKAKIHCERQVFVIWVVVIIGVVVQCIAFLVL
ncbi:unnamed protein product [Phytomonas sp. Hart1]|nr:unnamed protein product [Phytomonas sp. Hart1]|eukprot:CCW70525.1 unnamed protein product [Phytomonas sp. isolate Hart1]